MIIMAVNAISSHYYIKYDHYVYHCDIKHDIKYIIMTLCYEVKQCHDIMIT